MFFRKSNEKSDNKTCKDTHNSQNKQQQKGLLTRPSAKGEKGGEEDP